MRFIFHITGRTIETIHCMFMSWLSNYLKFQSLNDVFAGEFIVTYHSIQNLHFTRPKYIQYVFHFMVINSSKIRND